MAERDATWVGAGDLQLIDVGVEDAIDKSNTGALIRILIGELDVNFPMAASERRCARLVQGREEHDTTPTFFRALEAHIKLLPVKSILHEYHILALSPVVGCKTYTIHR